MPSLVRKPNGLLYIRVRVRDEHGAQHETTVPTGLRSIAKAKTAMPDLLAAWKRQQAVEEAARAEDVKAAAVEAERLASPTLAEYMRAWLKEKAPTLAEHTVDSYTWLIEGRIAPFIGNLRVPDIRRRHIREHLEAEARRPTARGTGVLSPRTIQMERNFLHEVLADAVGDDEGAGLLAANPVFRIRTPKIVKAPPRSMTEEQALAFLAAATQSRNHALWVLAVTTGARIGELLGLRWDDVDLDRGDLYIRTTLLTRKAPKLGPEPKRRQHRRRLRLGTSAVAVLRRHQAAQRAAIEQADGFWGDPGIVFATREGRYQRLSNLSRHSERTPEGERPNGKPRRKPSLGDYARVLKRAGLPWFRPHDLRHTMATLALAHGEHVKVVSERLGHTSVRTTLEMYAGILPGMDADLATWLDGLVPPDADG